MMLSGKNYVLFLRSNAAVFIFFAILVLAAKAPFLSIPLFWDEMPFGKAAWAVCKNNFNPFIEFWSYKPPLVLLLVALVHKLFGYSLVLPRIMIAGFSIVTLWFTFLLGQKLYNRKVGFWASLFLFTSPLFFAQSGFILSSVPLTAFAVLTLYSFIADKKILYFVSGTLLVLTRETGVLLIIAIIIYKFIVTYFSYKTSKKTFLNLASLFLPLIVFFAWMIANKLFLGWFLSPMHAYNFFRIAPLSAKGFKNMVDNIFIAHFRWVISAIILSGFSLSIFKKNIRERLFKRELVLFILFILIVILFFLWMGPRKRYAYLPRYFLFLHPLLYIFGAAAIVNLFKNKIIQAVIMLSIAGLFISCWYTPEVKWAGEWNLEYRHIVKAHKKTAEFLEDNADSFSLIITVWPVSSQLFEPRFGYVKKRLENIVYILHETDFKKIDKIIHFKKTSEPNKNIAIVMPKTKAINKGTRELPSFLETKKLQILKVFKSGKETVTIYIL